MRAERAPSHARFLFLSSAVQSRLHQSRGSPARHSALASHLLLELPPEHASYLEKPEDVGHHNGDGAGRGADDSQHLLGFDEDGRLSVGATHVGGVLLDERLDEGERLLQRVGVPGAGVQDAGAQGDVGQQLGVAVDLVQGVEHGLQAMDAVLLLNVPARRAAGPPGMDREEAAQGDVPFQADGVRRVHLLAPRPCPAQPLQQQAPAGQLRQSQRLHPAEPRPEHGEQREWRKRLSRRRRAPRSGLGWAGQGWAGRSWDGWREAPDPAGSLRAPLPLRSARIPPGAESSQAGKRVESSPAPAAVGALPVRAAFPAAAQHWAKGRLGCRFKSLLVSSPPPALVLCPPPSRSPSSPHPSLACLPPARHYAKMRAKLTVARRGKPRRGAAAAEGKLQGRLAAGDARRWQAGRQQTSVPERIWIGGEKKKEAVDSRQRIYSARDELIWDLGEKPTSEESLCRTDNGSFHLFICNSAIAQPSKIVQQILRVIPSCQRWQEGNSLPEKLGKGEKGEQQLKPFFNREEASKQTH
ncbi:hypothetical protein E2320_014914 [Naja naja]|nr:hypothetical protein E2320_014914 [Naja naja]